MARSDGAGYPAAGRADAPAGRVVALNGRREILPDRPIAELGVAAAAAFAARTRDVDQTDLFAYVVQSGLPARTDAFGALLGLDLPSVMRLVDYGIAAWPPDQAHRPIVVFERPSGGRLVASLDATRPPMTEDQVTRTIILPMIATLREFKLRRLFHGTINPTNLFLHEGGRGAAVQLGECVTAPPGYHQPLLFETIERGMAQPAGRGNGTMADDLYALGATILFLLLGRHPTPGLEPEALLAAKIEKGSFGAMCGDARLSLGMLEPLRGLLMDDPQQRWTIDDLDLWVSGRRLSPRQAQPPRRASRPLAFGGGEHWTARSLAAALAAAPGAADALIESGELDAWLRRSLEHEAVADRVAEGVRTAAAGRGGSAEERRVARVVMALDPAAPIRYRGKAVVPDGVGGALAEAMVAGAGAQEIAEIIAGQLPMFWINVQESARAEVVPMARLYDTMRGYLERTQPGFGIERCLYELAPSMPCLSPLVAGRCVMEPDRLLSALEEVAGAPDRPRALIDRHVAAFAAAHAKVSARHFAGLAEAEPRRRALAALGLLAELQEATGVAPLPNLCAWLVEVLRPVVDGFHSRTLRRRLADEMASQAATGRFENLLALAHDPGLAARDDQAFQRARRQFADAAQRIAAREREMAAEDGVGGAFGRQLAAVGASLAAAALLVGVVLAEAG